MSYAPKALRYEFNRFAMGVAQKIFAEKDGVVGKIQGHRRNEKNARKIALPRTK
jgi:hypothetical protein